MRLAAVSCLALVASVGASLPAGLAAEQTVAPSVADFARLLDVSKQQCVFGSSHDCARAVWAFVDTDDDGFVSRTEASNAVGTVSRWARADNSRPKTRAATVVAVFVTNLVGIDDIFDSYDTDGDGRLSWAETTADIYLDERPMGVVLRDPETVNAAALRDRFGLVGSALHRIVRMAGSRFRDAELRSLEEETSTTVAYRGSYIFIVDEFRDLAEKGDPNAQFDLALLYEQGLGVPTDPTAAARWYQAAAAQGHTDAQNSLGYMYSKGLGVAQDYIEAAKWFRASARQGNAAGQANLGYSYFAGQGVPKDFAQSYVWFSLAAAQGIERAATARDDLERMMSPQELVNAGKLVDAFTQ
ncbi:MAG: hypothetical protein ACE5Q3_09065 [Alphaproteobacteria bacterium]